MKFDRRKIKDGVVYVIMMAALLAVIAVLASMLFYIARQAWPFFKPSLFSSNSEHGILPMLVTTVYLALLSIVVALPVGVITAIYLNEYAKNNAPVRLLRLAIETLAAVPSIIYGLFGLLVFCRFFQLGQSILSGAFTLSIMILPVIIRTTEEALKTVPDSFREGSLSLGATKFQTIFYITLPAALPGIASSAILALGRVAGESAPVLLTVGIAKNLPRSIFDSGRTLTIHLYYLTKEAISPEDFGTAFASSAVLIVLVLCLNTAMRGISARLGRLHV
jgi:phosphate transport system permease protein